MSIALTMTGTIDRCFLFTFRTSPDTARRFLPRGLQPVVQNGDAFWSVLVAHLRAMRPRGVPAALGMRYWHVGYRLFVRLGDIEGLYFVRSDCDRRLMTIGGNLMTDFRFHDALIAINDRRESVSIHVDGGAPAAVELLRREPSVRNELPPFPHHAISMQNGTPQIMTVERNESRWRESQLTISRARWSFFDGIDADSLDAREAQPMDYVWHRARPVQQAAMY